MAVVHKTVAALLATVVNLEALVVAALTMVVLHRERELVGKVLEVVG
jgi:hypothetical protein